MIHHLVDRRGGEAFKKMVPDYKHCGHSAEAIEKIIAWFSCFDVWIHVWHKIGFDRKITPCRRLYY